MRKAWPALVMLLLVLLVACDSKEVTPTATPAEVLRGTPAAVTSTDLAIDPAAYQGQLVELNGQYNRLPLPSCNAIIHLPPASWSLSNAGVIIQAAGLEGVLDSLVPDGLSLTVLGRWQRWDGPIGCGQAAVDSTIWYLQVAQILWPNPLSAATLTPVGAAPPVAEVSPTSTTDRPGEPAEFPTESPLTSTPSLSVCPTPTVLYSPLATLSRTITPTPSGTLSSVFSPTPTPTGPFSPIASPTLTPTPSATSEMTSTGTVYPTFTPAPTGSATPTASPSPTSESAGQPVDMGAIAIFDDLDDKTVVNGRLAVGEVHRWTFDVRVDGLLTISVGPDASFDAKLFVFDVNEDKLVGRDDQSAGETETVEDLLITADGAIFIQIEGVAGSSGDYALVLMDESSEAAILFMGNLEYKDSVSRSLATGVQDLWHFQGQAGDVVEITLSTNDDIDLQFHFFGPDMGDPIAIVDNSGTGESETASFTLSQTGFYSIGIKEYSGVEGSYALGLVDP